MKAFTDLLQAQHDIGSVEIGPDIPEHCFRDWMTVAPRSAALARVRPGSAAQVSNLMKLCSQYRVPVVPQGGLTGLAGGAKPVEGCVLVSLEHLKGIEDVDIASSSVVARAGSTMQDVQEAARASGLYYPLDLGGRGTCTVGGNLSTNAGGNRVLRYGMARDLVLGLEVVLADGTILSNMNRMLKNNTGYDLKQLFIGSEGTLGIITRAALKLSPQPRSTSTALCALKDYDAVLKLLGLVRGGLGAHLSAFELMWPDFYERMTSGLPHLTKPLPDGHGAYVLIESQGSAPASDREHFERVLSGALEDGLLEDAVIAQSESEALRIWAVRDSSGQFRAVFWPHVGFDISIPVGSIGAFVEDLKRQLRARWSTADTIFFGHIADSNVHISVKVCEGEQPERDIEDLVYAAVGQWRGSVSAEHGIGTIKRDYLHLSRTAEELAIMKTLKRSLDPLGILNPGKIF